MSHLVPAGLQLGLVPAELSSVTTGHAYRTRSRHPGDATATSSTVSTVKRDCAKQARSPEPLQATSAVGRDDLKQHKPVADFTVDAGICAVPVERVGDDVFAGVAYRPFTGLRIRPAAFGALR